MNYGESQIACWWHRSYGESQTYLVALSVGTDHGRNGDAYPMARAVMDDFGTLVLIRGWL